MALKVVTSANYSAPLFMMDMTKAFDPIHRLAIMEDISSILLPEEIHLIKIMFKDAKLSVTVEIEVGELFATNIGTLQGDCLSPNIFILLTERTERAHKQITPREMIDHKN